MSISSFFCRGGRGEKGGIAEAVFPAHGGKRLGHCKICNVLSQMWSAIGNLEQSKKDCVAVLYARFLFFPRADSRPTVCLKGEGL